MVGHKARLHARFDSDEELNFSRQTFQTSKWKQFTKPHPNPSRDLKT
jgi:hypothetical protein